MTFAFLKRKKRDVLNYGVLLTVLIVLMPCSARALDGQIDVGCGYDDNVETSSEKQGSGFMRYQLQLYQPVMERDAFYIEAYGQATAYQFWRTEDRREFLLGVSCLNRWRQGDWHSQFYVEGHSYRDELVAEDEYTAVEGGCQLEHFVDEHLILALSGHYRYADYRQGYTRGGSNGISAGLGKGNGNGQGIHQPGSKGEMAVDESRRDREFGFIGLIEYRFNADLFSTLDVFYRDNDSTLAWESYQSYGVEHGWQFQLTSQLNSELWGSWLTRDYNESDEQQMSVGVRFDWQWHKHLSTYLQWQLVRQRSDSLLDDYSQKVATCGLYWLF
nr:hypothetical protein [uncultured Desulfuromonas sp.]